MSKSNEPAFWSLFSAGGMVAAFFVPVTLLLTGIGVRASWILEDELFSLIRHPFTRLYLFILISLCLFHWAHRFRYVATDIGLKRLGIILPMICYGVAIIGEFVALFLLLRL